MAVRRGVKYYSPINAKVGLQLWELLCEEHDIAPNGTRKEGVENNKV